MHARRVMARWWLPAVLLALVPLGSAWAAGTPAGTVISNFATLTYKDANGNSLPLVTSNTVQTVVAQVAGVDVSPATSSAVLAAGASTVFTAQVTNVGNGADTFTLSYDAPPAGWTAVLYGDADADGVLDTEERVPGNVVTSVALSADASKYVFLVITSPLAASDGASDATSLAATSQFDTGVSDAGVYTATVQTAVMSGAKSAASNTPKPGDVVTYTVVATNVGSNPAYEVVITDAIPAGVTYVPASIRIGADAGVTYATATPVNDDGSSGTGDFGVTTANTVTVNWGTSVAGEQVNVFFRAQVNDGIAAGTVINNTANIVYKATPGGGTLGPVPAGPTPITVQPKPSFTLSATALAQTGTPGDVRVYAFSLTNTGNSTDKFNYTPSTTSGYVSHIWVDANNDGTAGNDGDFELSDTNGDGKVDTGNLTSGTVAYLLVTVTIPTSSADLAVDVTTLAIASVTDAAVTGSVALTTTTNAPILSIVKSVDPVGSQPPNTVLTYTVVVTNDGHGAATAISLVDAIPTNTTYVANSVTVDGAARTDEIDGDNAKVEGGNVVVSFASVAASTSATVTFQVRIN